MQQLCYMTSFQSILTAETIPDKPYPAPTARDRNAQPSFDKPQCHALGRHAEPDLTGTNLDRPDTTNRTTPFLDPTASTNLDRPASPQRAAPFRDVTRQTKTAMTVRNLHCRNPTFRDQFAGYATSISPFPLALTSSWNQPNSSSVSLSKHTGFLIAASCCFNPPALMMSLQSASVTTS